MNYSYCKVLTRTLLACSVVSVLFGCQQGGSELPARKKMPGFQMENESFEGAPAFQRMVPAAPLSAYAFNTQNVDLNINGITQSFVYISLPDPSTDQSTINLLENFKPFALPLLAGWAQQHRHGVEIDLCAHNGETKHRSDFVLEQPNGFNFPIVVIWDRLSENRLNAMRRLVGELPVLRLNLVSSDETKL